MKPSPALALTLVKRILASRSLRYGFVALTLALGVYYIADQWNDIHRALDRIGLPASALALASVLAALVCTMLVWRILLAGLGSPLPYLTASRVLFVGQLGKYLPGSVWPVLAQMELAAEHEVPRHRTGAASIITMGLSLLCALLTGVVTLPFTGGVTQYWWAFLIAAPLVACVYPPLLSTLLRFGFKILRRAPLEQPITGRVIATAMGWSLVSWVFYGLQIWVLMIRVGARPATALPLAVGGFAFAFAVGFVIVLAPAGAGFREILLIALLSPAVGTGPATAITLVSRVATTLADVIIAGVVIVSHRLEKKRAASSGSAGGLLRGAAAVRLGEANPLPAPRHHVRESRGQAASGDPEPGLTVVQHRDQQAEQPADHPRQLMQRLRHREGRRAHVLADLPLHDGVEGELGQPGAECRDEGHDDRRVEAEQPRARAGHQHRHGEHAE
jgi:glycosyltransferase 2 family protein